MLINFYPSLPKKNLWVVLSVSSSIREEKERNGMEGNKIQKEF